MAERNETPAADQQPLAVTRTELVWEGKYNSAGIRIVPLPFQTVETVNESAVAVKVIDIPGNDTIKTVKVKVK